MVAMTTPPAPDAPEAADLPDWLRRRLRSAYADYAEAAAGRREDRVVLGARIADLVTAVRAHGWPAARLAEICGVSSERLRQLGHQYGTGAGPALDQPIPRRAAVRTARRRTPRGRAHLTAEQAAAIRHLAPVAARHAGSMPGDSPQRRASEELTALIRHHHERGVIWAELSDATRPWEIWPIPEETLQQVRAAEASDSTDSPMPPLLRVSGLRQRVARSR